MNVTKWLLCLIGDKGGLKNSYRYGDQPTNSAAENFVHLVGSYPFLGAGWGLWVSVPSIDILVVLGCLDLGFRILLGSSLGLRLVGASIVALIHGLIVLWRSLVGWGLVLGLIFWVGFLFYSGWVVRDGLIIELLVGLGIFITLGI